MNTSIADVKPASTLLEYFEELGAFNGTGIIDIKPFRDWRGSRWQHKIFTFRLCNAGEMLDIGETVSKYSETARMQAYRIETLIKSIFKIDGRPLITAEELAAFNTENNSSLSSDEYLRMWFRNVEDVVISRLDAVVNALKEKQIRALNGIYACEVSTREYREIPQGAAVIKYSLGEIIEPQYIEDSKVIVNGEELSPDNYDIDYIHDIPSSNYEDLELNESTEHRSEKPDTEVSNTPKSE